MEIDISGLGLNVRGRSSKTEFAVVRELDSTDITAILSEGATKAKPLKKLRARHHALAKGLAEGMSEQDCSVLFGYSSSHISILKTDQSFQDLVEFYKGTVHEAYKTGHQVMADLQLDSAEILRERMEEDPDVFTPGQLLEIMKATADRTGLGPTQKVEGNIKIGLAEKLEQAARRQSQTLIDITPEDDE